MRVKRLTVLKCAVLTAALLTFLSLAAARCPDPKLQEAVIGGNTIAGGVVLHRRSLRHAKVRLYFSSGEIAWAGKTDKNGRFATSELKAGDYRIEIRGWGTTTIHLNPELDKRFMQKPAWGLLFVDNTCVADIQVMN